MVTQYERELRDSFIDYENGVRLDCDWVRMDGACRRSGQVGKKQWSGDFDRPNIGNVVTVWPGCCSGTVADYGISRVGDVFERAVWVMLDNGEFVKCTGRECRPLTEADSKYREKQNVDFRKLLISAGKKMERQRKERRQRQVMGSHLLDDMLAAAKGLMIDEKSSFYKITGRVKGKTVYVAIKGGRVDLSGFYVEHESVVSLSEEEARRRHLGKVRGQLDFTRGDASAMEAYRAALALLSG